MRTTPALLGFILLATSAAVPVAIAQPAPGSIPLTTIVASGASPGLSGPVGIASPGDGSGRLFVIQQSGAIRVVRNGAVLATNYMALANASTQCAATVGGALANTGFTVASERGLLGMAFHPNFENNGQFFLSYTAASGHSMITRYTKSDPTTSDVLSASDLQTCVIILRVNQDFSNHNGGNILFGPDGFLYFGLGDGGDGNDPCNRAQTLDPAMLDNSAPNCDVDPGFTSSGGNANSRALLGKMVRIDIDNTTPAGANGLCASRADGSANYAIPATNPFQGGNLACDETWAYGLRNPWRWSFDRQTNDLIIGDVGQDRWEEVSLLAPNTHGANFGWKICEGLNTRGSCTTACSVSGDIEPIITYNNSGNGCSATNPTPAGCSVTGGFRYRGPDAALQGVYFYGDACNSELRYSVDNVGSWVQPSASVIVTGLAGSVVGFGEDEAGALYMVAGNALVRIGGAGASVNIFANGFE